MKNFINRALVAKKHLKLFFALFAMLALGVTNAWGAEDVTFNYADYQGKGTQSSGSSYTMEKSGMLSIGNDKFYGNTSYAHFYANGTITVTPATGVTITKIVLTASATNYNGYQNSGTITASAGTISGNGTTVTWTGSATNAFTLKNNKQIRWTKIVVTYESQASQSYSVILDRNGEQETINNVASGTSLDDIDGNGEQGGCAEWSFVGWSKSQRSTQDDSAPMDLVTKVDGEGPYYAVYSLTADGGGGSTTKTMTSFTALSGNIDGDANVSYAAAKGNAATAPAVNSNEIRIYQNGGTLTITANNGNKLTSITIGSSMTTSVSYKIDGGTESSAQNISASGKFTLSDIDATTVLFTCKGTDKNSRLYLNYLSVTYSAGSTVYYTTTPDCGSAPQPAVLVSIAKTAGKTEFTEGDTFEKATITATYDDATTKDVTSLATFTGYDMNTTGTQTVNVTYEGKSTSYTITVNPKPKYTITWNNAGTTNTTEVVQGEALGTLPEPADCLSGKKFMGWTAATEVNNDGSSITYIKPTDKPTANTTYYAVFAVVEGGDGTPTTATVSIADYANAKSWTDATQYNEINIDANLTATANGGGNTGKYYENGNNWRLYQNESPTLTISAAASCEIQTVKVTYSNSNNGVLTLEGSNVTSEMECTINAASVTFGVGNTGSATNGQVRITAIEVVYAFAAKKSDYSLNCDIHQDPNLTLLETAINFGTVAQNATVTETLKVSGGYLAEDVALTISGTDASFFSVGPTTIAKADEVDQDVTITYNPTATGEHTATLTIKTGDITKTVALSGTVLAPGKWVLVKNVTELSAGDEVIIVSAASNYAIGNAATNNYKGAAITKVGETANTTAEVTILTVEETGVAEAPYAFKTDGKYLYAAGSDKNYLKAQVTNNENGQWAVTITAEGVASIVAAKSSNRNVMQCNPNGGSPIFACYSSASYEALAIYRNSENVAKPVLSGDVDFTGSTQVTITAKSGLTVYYTTDGSTPDKNATQYSTPFTISATTTVKAIAYDATDNASPVAEMTFTKHELVNVADAMALAEDEVAYFAEFEVVKVVAGKGNIYIKDASGHGLIYDNTLAGQLKDGDRVQGFVGISSPYNGLPEAKPYNVTYADLTITDGTAAEPYDFTSTVIAETDINKYIVFQDVEVTANTDMSSNPTLTIGGNNVKFYNQFGVSKTLEAGKIYDIYGFVAVYEKDGNRTLQVYFYEAVQDGEVIQKYTVTYNAGGATGTVPVDNAEYSEGAEVYLKSVTGLTYEGYEYKGWKVTDESDNEITVTSNKFNMPASNVTVTAQWEEIVAPEIQDFSTGYWVLVTDESELQSDDYVVIAAADYDVAMKSYENGNNCKQIAVTKLGNQFIKWTSEMGVFQLAANGSNYTIQDVNTEEYLYAAGTGSNNYLKAADEVPADADAAKPYIWTISYTDGVATVKATSDNRNTLMYNTGSDLFACYASGQKAVALYKHVDNIDPTLVTPTIVKNAYFSVGNNKYVQFSTGNLQYEVGTNTWSFASEQYEVIGGAAYDGTNNTNYGMNVPGYTGKLDLFGWSSDGKFGVNPSNTDAHYGYAGSDFVDWGELVNETGWYTLTKEEMNYILNRKKDGKKLWALATINDLVGLILLPDNWDTNINLVYGYIPEKFVYTKNLLSIAEWQTLEEAGAVFLPAGGSRTGGYGNTDKAGGTGTIDANGHYFHVDNVNIYGYYWLNTQDPRETHKNCASFLILPGWDEGPTVDEEGLDDLSTRPQVWSREKRRGNSVRLVKAIEPNYTRDNQSAGVYGTVCYPENIVWCDGATLYEVAGKEGNKVIFDEVTAPEAGKPYIFIANQENLYFFCGTDVAATADRKNSLQGTFEQIAPAADNVLVGNYMLVNNIVKKCGINCGLYANRAYFVATELENMGTAPAAVQGRRRISLDVASENTATGLDNLTNGENTTTKVIENGQLIIIRGGEKFNAQGQRL